MDTSGFPTSPKLSEQEHSTTHVISGSTPTILQNNEPIADLSLRVALYQIVASRRLGYDTLIWQVPALGLTAQAFLFTTALSANSPPARFLAASLAFIIALISMQLMAKHRYHEEVDARLLESFERTEKLDDLIGCAPHARSDKREEALVAMSRTYTDINPVRSSWFTKWSSYRLWIGGLALFAIAALGIMLSTIIDFRPVLDGIIGLIQHVRLP